MSSYIKLLDFMLTLYQMDDYMNQLFSYVDPSRVMTLSCGHVIPPSQLLACPVIPGPDNSPFDFTFGKRDSDKMVSAPKIAY